MDMNTRATITAVAVVALVVGIILGHWWWP